MSHFTTLSKVEITDKKAFIKACAELGFTQVKENATLRGYQGKTLKAEVVCSKPGCKYDIGLVRKGKKLELTADWWGVDQHASGAEQKIGQLTTRHTISRKYAKLGFMSSAKTDKVGNLVLKLRR